MRRQEALAMRRSRAIGQIPEDVAPTKGVS